VEDWGGPVAFSVAAHHPDAVRTLTILDVVIPGDGGDFSQGGRRWDHAFFRTLHLPEQLCFGRKEMVIIGCSKIMAIARTDCRGR
jgi:pimeloyl-ACP methyl ester carboxylesterase